MSATLAAKVTAIAAGQLAAQKFVHALREDRAIPAEALEHLQAVQIEHGVESPAVRAWLSELAKRVR